MSANPNRGLLGFFKTRPNLPVLDDPEIIHRLFTAKRWSVFLSILFGYSFFYVCRQSFGVVKKPMLDAGIMNADQMGQVGFALFITYAIGKCVNGFLADRSNISRFMSTGLLGSAIIIVLFGFTKVYIAFVILWGLHGWFQSMGAAPSGVALSQWFSNKERGSRYSIWSASHGIGEGLTFLITATIVAYLGWRWGFWASGLISALIAFILYKTLADRPETYGLPNVADYRNDHAPEAIRENAPATVAHAQLEVLRNPYVWIVGLSSAAMYISRYGVNSWGVLYLQEAKHYPLISAGFILFVAKISETVGTVLSGIISDRFFGARRNVTTLVYGLVQIVGLVILMLGPSTHISALPETLSAELKPGPVSTVVRDTLAQNGVVLKEKAQVVESNIGDTHSWKIIQNSWGLEMGGYHVTRADGQLNIACTYRFSHLLGISCFGFGLGGLLVFLGGLIAIDICSKKATGAAMGLVGLFSYIATAIQERVSGKLIQAGEMIQNGQKVHDFTYAYGFWLGAAIVSMLLACCVWNAKARD